MGELREERMAVRRTIEGLLLTPVMFEEGARSHPPVEVYRSYLSQSDVFVGLYWQSHGLPLPGEPISGLEDEFHRSTGLPQLVYVKEPAPERDTELTDLINTIRFGGRITYKRFRTTEELVELFSGDLMNLLSERFLVPAERRFPTGTVTFLFIDIEGSTRLLARLGSTYKDVLAEFRELVRDEVSSHAGVEVDTAGDGFFVVFESAVNAIDAALGIQLVLAGHRFEQESEVKVRMGLHTGEGVLGDETYIGMDVHRAARIGAAGHGGQIVISSTTARLIKDRQSDFVIKDVGLHRLKDLPEPEHLFSISAPGLPSEFPRLRSLDASRTNLPTQLTNFVGRRHERNEVSRLLDVHRLITVTGTGGTGKTRLAIQLARDLLLRFPDGAWMVSLAPVSAGSGVAQACLTGVGAQEQPGRSLVAALVDYLAPRKMLLILDNCEHVVAACASLVAQLLTGCEHVTVLATSRQPLGLPGEVLFALPPLAVPTATTPASESDAVELFVDRARAVRPGFSLSDDNIKDVVELVGKLEGLPLALELAAARLRSMSPGEILARLGSRFELLANRGSQVDERHRTINAAIDWSHQLADDAQRSAFRRLSVFAGGWELEAAEAVISGDADDRAAVVDLVADLVDQSLVLADERDGRIRYRMLEAIRSFAQGKLSDAGEESEYRERHAQWFLSAFGSYTPYFGPPSEGERSLKDWYRQVQIELDNVRASHDWFVGTGDAKCSLELVAGLGWFWFLEGLWAEGKSRSLASFALSESAAVEELKPLAALTAAYCAFRQGDFREAEHLAGIAHDLATDLGSLELVTMTTCALALAAMVKGDLAESKRLADQGLAIAQQVDVVWLKSWAHMVVGRWAFYAGDMAQCMTSHNEAYRAAASIGEPWGTVGGLMGMGATQFIGGDLASARKTLGQALELSGAGGVQDDLNVAMAMMGLIMHIGGDVDEGLEYVRRGSGGIIQRREWTGRAVLAGLIVPTLERLGETEVALDLSHQALEIAKQLDDNRGQLRILASLIRLNARTGNRREAVERTQEMIALNNQWGTIRHSIATLLAAAEVLGRFGEVTHAARLWGAARALIDRSEATERFIETELLRAVGEVIPLAGETAGAFENGRTLDAAAALAEAEATIAVLQGQLPA